MKLSFVAAVGAVLLGVTSARANFIAIYTSNTVNVFNYTLRFTVDQPGEVLKAGDMVTLYDLSPPADITSVVGPAGFTVTQQFTGITPAGLVGAPGSLDVNSLQNITFTYTGAEKTVSTDFTGVVLTMASIYHHLRVGTESGSTEINFFLSNGNSTNQASSLRAVLLPAVQGGDLNTPEPASLAMIGVGAGVLLVRRRKA